MQPTLTGQHCGGIADPDLIGASNSEVLQSVSRDGSAVAAISDGRSILGALSSEEPLQAHKDGQCGCAVPDNPAHEPIGGCRKSGDCEQIPLGCAGARGCFPVGVVRVGD